MVGAWGNTERTGPTVLRSSSSTNGTKSLPSAPSPCSTMTVAFGALPVSIWMVSRVMRESSHRRRMPADQQLGGLVMWAPAGLAYLCAGLALAATWLQSSYSRGSSTTSSHDRLAPLDPPRHQPRDAGLQ